MTNIKMGNQEFSNISTGFWRIVESGLTTDQIKDFLLKLHDMGVDTIDNAQVYGGSAHKAEEVLGDVFRAYPELKAKFKIVTKTGIPNSDFGHYNYGYDYIIKSCNDSLKAMDIDVIDIYLLHRPDVFCDFNEVYDALKLLIDEGKIKQVGVSNYSPIQFKGLSMFLEARGINLVTNQIEFNLFTDEHIKNDNIFFLKGKEISPMVWSPVGGGRLNELDETVISIANKYDLTPAGISYAFINNTGLHPQIVLGSFKAERFAEAIEAMEVKIDIKDMYKLLKTITKVDVL